MKYSIRLDFTATLISTSYTLRETLQINSCTLLKQDYIFTFKHVSDKET